MKKRLFKSTLALFLSAILILGNLPQVHAANPGDFFAQRRIIEIQNETNGTDVYDASDNDNGNGNDYANGNGNGYTNGNDYGYVNEIGYGYENGYSAEADEDYEYYLYHEEDKEDDVPITFYADGVRVVQVGNRRDLQREITTLMVGASVIIELTQSFYLYEAADPIAVAGGRDVTIRSTKGYTFYYHRLVANRHFVVTGTLRLENVSLRSSLFLTPSFGGIAVNNHGRLYLENGSELTGNRANGPAPNVSNGGAIFIAGGGTATINGGRIHNNLAFSLPALANVVRNGGAAHIASGGTLIMNGGAIENNRANGSGGAINIAAGGTFIMNGGTISNNQAGNVGLAVNTFVNVNAIGGGINISQASGGGAFRFFGGEVVGNSVGDDRVPSNVSPWDGWCYVTGIPMCDCDEPDAAELAAAIDALQALLERIQRVLFQDLADNDDFAFTNSEFEQLLKENRPVLDTLDDKLEAAAAILDSTSIADINAALLALRDAFYGFKDEMIKLQASNKAARQALVEAIENAQSLLDSTYECEFGDGIDIANIGAPDGQEWASRANRKVFETAITAARGFTTSTVHADVLEAKINITNAYDSFNDSINVFNMYVVNITINPRGTDVPNAVVTGWTGDISRNPAISTKRKRTHQDLYAIVQVGSGGAFNWVMIPVMNYRIEFYTAGPVDKMWVIILGGDNLPARDRIGSRGVGLGFGLHEFN